MLSIVIPTLNAAASLPATLAALNVNRSAAGRTEIVIADGGSQDRTTEIAERFGARVVRTARGRGRQLAAGAAAARGDWLLFLHADTLVHADWPAVVARFIDTPANAERAAVFAFALDDPHPMARRMERLVAWRCRVLGLPYGDQGLLIGRAFYRKIGGFRPIELMEDVDIVRRIGRRRLVLLPLPAVTSAARYRAGGYWRRPLRNLLCLHLYFVGVPPRTIARLYG